MHSYEYINFKVFWLRELSGAALPASIPFQPAMHPNL